MNGEQREESATQIQQLCDATDDPAVLAYYRKLLCILADASLSGGTP
jgi:hypothetical protein